MAVTCIGGISVTSKTAHQILWRYLILLLQPHYEIPWYTFADPRSTKNQLYCLIGTQLGVRLQLRPSDASSLGWPCHAPDPLNTPRFSTQSQQPLQTFQINRNFVEEGTHPTCKASEVIEKFCQAAPSTSLHRVQAKSSFGPLMHQRNLRDKKTQAFDNANYHVGNTWHLALWFNVATCHCLWMAKDLSSLSPITYQQESRVYCLLPCKCFHFSSIFISTSFKPNWHTISSVLRQMSSPRVSRKQNEPPQHWQGPNHRIKGACNSAPEKTRSLEMIHSRNG